MIEYRTHKQHLDDFFRSATSENARAVVNEIESLRRVAGAAEAALGLVLSHSLPGIYQRGLGTDATWWRCDGCGSTSVLLRDLTHKSPCPWFVLDDVRARLRAAGG